jgi:hypothetical protein
VALLITIPELAGLNHRFEVLGVDHNNEAIVSAHPVEVGAEVTDHIQVLPVAFTVEVFVTESPTLIPAVGSAVEAAILFLEQAQGKLLTVVLDGEGTWQSMALTRWPHRRTALLGRPLTLSFRQIRIAQGVSVVIPPRQPAPVAQVSLPDETGLGVQSLTAGSPASTLAVGADVATDAAAAGADALRAMFGF